jgi:hypothetical protein
MPFTPAEFAKFISDESDKWDKVGQVYRHQRMRSAENVGLLNYLVGDGEQRWRHDEGERLGSFEVDDKLVLGRRLHW